MTYLILKNLIADFNIRLGLRFISYMYIYFTTIIIINEISKLLL